MQGGGQSPPGPAALGGSCVQAAGRGLPGRRELRSLQEVEGGGFESQL